MDTSESQFQELLAHVIARTNKMLNQQGYAFPLGLILQPGGDVEVSVAAYERPEQVEELVNAMQTSMRSRIAAVSAIASCISVPERGGQSMVAFLENHENYCAKVSIPISADVPKLDADNLTVDDGSILVFPIASS